MTRTDAKDGQTPSRAETDDDFEASLAELRKNIDAIDQQIVALLAERQEQVERVVTLKREHNQPIYHPAREEDLITRRRHQGEEAGLNPNFVEEMFRGIMRQSRVAQSRQMAQKAVRPGAGVLIVGGTGAMGRYFHQWFDKAGYRVKVMGRAGWPGIENLCRDVDLVMLSVPIDQTNAIAKRIGPYLSPDTILLDITSIKVSPLQAMLEAHSGPVLGLHPVFGPTGAALDKQIIVATPGRDEAACQWVLDQFRAWGAIVLPAEAEEHDDIMDIVQALRHFATFSFGQFLCRKNISLSRSLEFSSPIYRLELGMVGRLFAQDPALYAEIIFASPSRQALLKEYIESLKSNLVMLEQGDKEIFLEEFRKIAGWFGAFSEQAMRESTFLIDKLIERF